MPTKFSILLECKGGRKCIKKFIKLHEPRVFDETFDTFEMNHNFEKNRKEEKIVF